MVAGVRRREWEPWALFALALVTRCWRLYQPDGVIFDEELYEQYISHYFTHTFYFNLHPPVGKLLLAFGAWVLDLNPVDLAYAKPAVALRIVPAVAGSLVIPVFWGLLRQVGATRRVATLGAFLLLCDTLLLIVSRFILIDAFLLLFILGSVSAWLAATHRAGRERWGLVVLSALLAGLAVGTKWSGLSALGVVGLLWLRDAFRRASPPRTLAVDAAILAIVPVAVYVAAFAVHFSLLPLSGGRDDTMMAPEFQATLQRNPAYRPDARLSLPRLLIDAHDAMRRGNAEYVGNPHPSASPWWSWPILKHMPYVYEALNKREGTGGHVLLVGNLIVWWGALLGSVACLFAAMLSARARERLAPHRPALALLGVAWAVNYLPFAVVSRILFLYSYLPALTFSLAFAVVGCGALAGWMRDDAATPWRFSSRASLAAYGGVAVLAFAFFVYFLPVATGEMIPDAAWQRRLSIITR